MEQKVAIKRAVITGATGMIGATLARLLLQDGVEVTALIRPGSPKRGQLPEHERLHIAECSLDDLGTCSLEDGRPYDAWFHLGWMGTYGDSRNDVYLQNRNIPHTLDAVTLAHRLGCRVFVGAGSQAEYGRVRENTAWKGKEEHPVGIPLDDTVPERPETGYGAAKLCAGRLSRILCESLGMRHVWTRFLSVYGPFDNSYTMVMSGIYRMLRGESPDYTKGEQMWDYIYSEDAARAMYLAAVYGRDQAVYCIGSGTARPLASYICRIRDAAAPGREIGIGKLPYPPGQVMYLCANISKLTEDTGFEPEISFEEGIRRTVDWCREEMKRK